MRDAGQATLYALAPEKRRRFSARNIVNFAAGVERSGTLGGLPRSGSPGWDGARENRRMIPTPHRSVLVPKKCSDLGERNGAVARINPSASQAAFPTPGSRHDGVGLRPTELGHPVKDVTPDHGLSPLRVAVPRPQAAPEH